MSDINRYAPGSGRLLRNDNSIANIADGINDDGSRNVRAVGDSLQEQLTELDAVGGVLTFSEAISTIEIYNTDLVNDGTFNVNGIGLKVPAGKVFKSSMGGTPNTNVAVTGATTYIVSRYE